MRCWPKLHFFNSVLSEFAPISFIKPERAIVKAKEDAQIAISVDAGDCGIDKSALTDSMNSVYRFPNQTATNGGESFIVDEATVPDIVISDATPTEFVKTNVCSLFQAATTNNGSRSFE